MAGNTSRPGVSVVSRAVAVLDAFDERHRRLTLTELARRADLPLPTTHRLVGELTAHGALARAPSGEYVIGRRIWSLGLLAPMQTGLREIASPFLQDLYTATLATINLAVREGPMCCTSTVSPANDRFPWSARWARVCRCTPPASARSCSHM